MDPFDKLITDIVESAPPEQRPVIADLAKRLDAVVRHERRWIEDLADTVETINRLGADASWPVFPMFWIRLHGAFTELLDAYRVWVEPAASAQSEPINRRRAIYTAVDEMLRALSDDEHVVADYYRQRAAHLKQEAYTVRFAPHRSPADVRGSGKATKVVNTRYLGHIEKKFSIEEADRILTDMVKKFGGERELAVHVAKKLRPHVKALADARDALRSFP
jgi:hypothetical protein